MLENQLAESPYWEKRFKEFNLSPDHLKKASFPFDKDDSITHFEGSKL